MRILRTVLCIYLITGFVRANASAIDSTQATPETLQLHHSATLTVRSVTPDVTVVLDSVDLGTTPLNHVQIDTGMHVMYFVHSDGRSWFHPSICESLNVKADEQIERTAAFPHIYNITSEPFGADVRCDDALVGTTPMILTTNATHRFVAIAKAGFRSTQVALPPTDSEVHVDLQPLPSNGLTAPTTFLATDKSKGKLPIYITTGATVLAGATAAYFKIQADRSYGDYQNLGSPGALDKTKQFDAFSGVALAVSQINLVALAYLLLSR
jgi:hypothetical protein